MKENVRIICLIAALLLINIADSPAQTFRDRLLPTNESYGFFMEGYWVWGSSVIKGDDGKYHMFASRWPRNIHFGHWLTNSEIVHAVSDVPEGPYTFSEVALPPRGEEYWDGQMTHNPAIRKHGDTYLLFYTGTTYKGDLPDEDHQISSEGPKKLDAHHHERIGLATSKSPYGPWERRDKPILDVIPDTWEQYLVSNAAPFVFDDGKVMLYYKGVEKLTVHAISIAFAEHWSGPYKRISESPFDVGVGAEDPNIWFENGQFHALMLDHDRKFSEKELYYVSSKDGLKWEIEENPVAVTKDVLFDDGEIRKMRSTERPWVLVEGGVATHVFFATGGIVDSTKYTWNMCIPLKSIAATKHNK